VCQSQKPLIIQVFANGTRARLAQFKILSAQALRTSAQLTQNGSKLKLELQTFQVA
jgi:hypothetical protein